jgi:hypothetical protein
MESWRRVWRDGFVPQLNLRQLNVLKVALATDDPKLLQGATTSPPPLECVRDWPCEGACLLGYCGWQGDGQETVGEVEDFFAHACFQADLNIGEQAACRWLLNWFDDTPRSEMRAQLLLEVEQAIIALTNASAA